MADREYYERVNEILDQSSGTLPTSTPPRPGRAWPVKRWLKRILLGAVAVLCLAYAIDFAQARLRLAGGGSLGSVTVNRYSVIHEKNNRMEFNYVGSDQQTCLRSLFPHFGYTPCWYARRHTEQQIDY
jgi:hypothetical protein